MTKYWIIFFAMLAVLLYVLCSAPAAAARYVIQVEPAIYVAPADVNDGLYKFLLRPAPGDWTAKFGDSERTLLIYNLSELRVRVGRMEARLTALLPPDEVVAEPNEVKDE